MTRKLTTADLAKTMHIAPFRSIADECVYSHMLIQETRSIPGFLSIIGKNDTVFAEKLRNYAFFERDSFESQDRIYIVKLQPGI